MSNLSLSMVFFLSTGLMMSFILYHLWFKLLTWKSGIFNLSLSMFMLLIWNMPFHVRSILIYDIISMSSRRLRTC